MTALRVIANVLFTCFQRVPVQPRIMFQVTEKSLQSDIEECTLTHVIQSICSKWNEIVLRSWGTEPQSEYTITVTDIEPGEVGEINQWRSALSFHFIDFSSWLWLSQRKLPKIGRARNGLQGNLKLRLKMAATPTPLSAIETSKELLNLKLWHTTFISFFINEHRKGPVGLDLSTFLNDIFLGFLLLLLRYQNLFTPPLLTLISEHMLSKITSQAFICFFSPSVGAPSTHTFTAAVGSRNNTATWLSDDKSQITSEEMKEGVLLFLFFFFLELMFSTVHFCLTSFSGNIGGIKAVMKPDVPQGKDSLWIWGSNLNSYSTSTRRIPFIEWISLVLKDKNQTKTTTRPYRGVYP